MMADVVRIACHFPNGISIRKSKPGWDDGTGDGVKPTVHDGPAVRLNGPSSLHTGAGNTHGRDLIPGITEVDAEWWRTWLEQNGQNPFVTSKQVYETKEPAE